MKKKKALGFKYPKRTKEEFDALFYVIRATKKHGWIKIAEVLKEHEQNNQERTK